jgi:hypothetical protein
MAAAAKAVRSGGIPAATTIRSSAASRASGPASAGAPIPCRPPRSRVTGWKALLA